MAEFRYKGVVVAGERADDDGVVVPNVLESVEMYGFTLHKRKYTEVPEDAIAVSGRRLNRDEGRLERYKVSVVEKLRGNPEVEEKVGNAQ